MRTIWKFTLAIAEEQTIDGPRTMRPLKLAKQSGDPTLWAEVETEDLYVPHKILMFGTGHELPADLRVEDHIGTVFDGGFVWHFFMPGVAK